MKKPKRNRYEVRWDRTKPASWAVYLLGARVAQENWTKRDAIKWAVGLARANMPSQLFIKGKNGRVQDERTYGSDPFPPRG